MTRSGSVRTGIALLRAGRAVRIVGSVSMAVAGVETASQELLDLLDPKREACLMISG